MNQKEKSIIGDMAEINLLTKFLNDPKRLGMTEEEQKQELEKIAEFSEALKQ